MSLTFNDTIVDFLELAIRATDADNLSAQLDIFIGIRDEFDMETQTPANVAAKSVNLGEKLSKTSSEVISIELSPLASSHDDFTQYSWDAESSILSFTPSTTPSSSLFLATLTLENGERIERLFPVTYSAGEIFKDDTSVENSWFYSDSLGLYYRNGDWAYTSALGWLYFDVTVSGSTFFFSESRGWFYTSESAWPYVFDTQSASWKYLYIEDEAAFLYDFDAAAYTAW